MKILKIKHGTKDVAKFFDIKIDKLIYVLSKLESNDDLQFESQEQIEALMKKHGLFDEYFLANVNKL